jgi:sugar lactone lactonase YvrE
VKRHAKASSAGSSSGHIGRRYLTIAVFAALVMALSISGAAVALQTHVKESDIDDSGTPNGFVSLAGLAVDESGGDLYAVDTAGAADSSGAINRFSSAGAFQNQISGTFSNPQDVAVDSSGTASDGNVYLADTGNNLIRAFDVSGASIPSFDTDGVLDGSGIPVGLNPDGAFSSPCGVAVEQTSGNLYVADRDHNRIWVFDSEGAYLDRVADSILQGPCGLAFDSTGDLYVMNANSANAVKFNKVGTTDFNYTGTVVDTNNASDVAADPSSDHVYVANGNQITEYDSAGSQVSTFGQEQLSNATGVAIDDVNGKVYVAEGSSLHVYGPLMTLPDVTTGSASNVQSTSATVSGSVDPAGGPTASCSFQWGSDTSYGQTAPCQPAGPFAAFQAVTADLSGLTVGTTYHYRVVSETVNGTSFGTDQSFQTSNAPLISVVQAPEVTATSARLRTVVNPNGTATTYRFEYGPDTSYGTSLPVPDGDLGAGDALASAVQLLSGLAPGTTYHYRVRAENSAGVSFSDDRTLHTYPTNLPTGLPDNRAYEMVSPPDKGGADIQGNLWHTVSAVDGNAISFAATAAFAGAGGTGIIANYVSKRSSDGWATTGLAPNQHPGNEFIPGVWNQSLYAGRFSPDLSKGIYFARESLLSEPNLTTANVLYRRDNLLSGNGPNPSQGAQYQTLSDSVVPITKEEHGTIPDRPVWPADANEDLSRILYESDHNLTQDAVAAGLDEEISKVYQWDHGTQRLEGILPGGAPTLSVAGRGVRDSSAPVNCGDEHYTHGTLSQAGEAAFFTSPPFSNLCFEVVNHTALQGTLYVRLNHTVTLQVNASERTDCAQDPTCGGDNQPDPLPDPAGPDPASLWTSSKNGNAFFLSREALTDDATRSTLNLYKYDLNEPVGSRLTLIASGVESVTGVSEDGQYVYFTSGSSLDPDYTSPPTTTRWLHVWHDGEIRVIGNGTGFGGGRSISWTEQGLNSASRVTPDGKAVLFESEAPTAAELSGQSDNTIAGVSQSCAPASLSGSGLTEGPDYCALETYLYRYDSDTLRCVSCPPTGQATDASGDYFSSGGAFSVHYNTTPSRPVIRVPSLILSGGGGTQNLTHALSDDGRRAFFTSFDPLVPTDTNGWADAYVYDWDSDEVRLISTGECNCDSSFVEASPDGSNAFFVTAQRLVGIDRDNNRDLYDARVDGGLASQNASPPAECQGDACQSPVGPPNDPTPASSSFQGAGNQPLRRHKRQKHRRHGKRKHKGRLKSHRAGNAPQSHRPTTTRSHG